MFQPQKPVNLAFNCPLLFHVIDHIILSLDPGMMELKSKLHCFITKFYLKGRKNFAKSIFHPLDPWPEREEIGKRNLHRAFQGCESRPRGQNRKYI